MISVSLRRVAVFSGVFVIGAVMALASRAADNSPPAGNEIRLVDHQAADSLPVARTAQEKWFKPLDRIEALIPAASGRVPPDRSAEIIAPTAQVMTPGAHAWEPVRFQWAATNLSHQPLYFDDEPLERYGQSVCPLLQPGISGVRFFTTLPVMPYKLGMDPPCEPVSTLGYYRPGSDAPCTRQCLPWDWNGAMVEAGTLTGAILLLP